MSTFKKRIIRAAILDRNLYEEVEADSSAIGQAMGVVILSSIAAGIGSISSVGFSGIFIGTIIALIGWFLWAVITYIIGVKFIPEPQTQSNIGELLRTIGFSSSPGLIRVVGIIPIPGLGEMFSFIALIWMYAAMIIAIRQALDYKSTLRAFVVCSLGLIVNIIIMNIFFI